MLAFIRLEVEYFGEHVLVPKFDKFSVLGGNVDLWMLFVMVDHPAGIEFSFNGCTDVW